MFNMAAADGWLYGWLSGSPRVDTFTCISGFDDSSHHNSRTLPPSQVIGVAHKLLALLVASVITAVHCTYL